MKTPRGTIRFLLILLSFAVSDPSRVTGEVPSPDRIYPGCPFADRCPIAEDDCRKTVPQLVGISRQVSCLKVEVK